MHHSKYGVETPPRPWGLQSRGGSRALPTPDPYGPRVGRASTGVKVRWHKHNMAIMLMPSDYYAEYQVAQVA